MRQQWNYVFLALTHPMMTKIYNAKVSLEHNELIADEISIVIVIASTTRVNGCTHLAFNQSEACSAGLLHWIQHKCCNRNQWCRNSQWNKINPLHAGSSDYMGLMSYHFKAKTKESPFSRRHFQVHFLDRKCSYFNLIFTKFCSWGYN